MSFVMIAIVSWLLNSNAFLLNNRCASFEYIRNSESKTNNENNSRAYTYILNLDLYYRIACEYETNIEYRTFPDFRDAKTRKKFVSSSKQYSI